MKKYYFDNGATTKVDKKVITVMNKYHTVEYGNASSLHDFGKNAEKGVNQSRITLAKKINALAEEIIFTSGGTESDNLAIIGSVLANKSKGNHIVTSVIEHPAVQKSFDYLKNKGFKVTQIGVDKEGIIKLNELKKALRKDTILVSIMHANNEIGTIQPIKEIGKLCRKKSIIFHTDAVQSFSKVPIDVKKQYIDLASFSGHKIHGPKGVGMLYKRKGIKLLPLQFGGSHEFKLRAGTENVPGIVGFAKAVTLIKKSDLNRMKKLRDYLIKEVLKISGSRLNGSNKKRLVNNANFSFKFIEGESILMMLNEKGIAVSTGSACSSKSLEPSHVLKAINVPVKQIQGSIRITLSKYTTKKEVDYLIKHLKNIIKLLTDMSPVR